MRSTRGFTLVELIVSIGLFMVVVTIAMSAYFSLINLDRKARALNDVVTSLSFAVDSMSRSIRTGTAYSCNGGTNCWGSGANNFSFTNESGQAVTYLLKSNGTIGQCISGACTSSSAQSITDPRITISNLTFYTQGVGKTGTDQFLQPRVIFTMTGTITPSPGAAAVTFTIQSSATQRFLDL